MTKENIQGKHMRKNTTGSIGQYTKQVAIRVEPNEHKQLKVACIEHNTTVSDFWRYCAKNAEAIMKLQRI
jgi:hypothetical protein